MADVAGLVEQACRTGVEAARSVSGGDICQAWRVTLSDGRTAFAKTYSGLPDLFDAEARSLAWLADGGAAVPTVLGVGADVLVLAWLDADRPTPAAAERLGRQLAAQHTATAEQFGAPWPGFAGRVRLRNDSATGWAEFFAATRLLPLIAAARDGGALDAAGASTLERVAHRLADLAGPPEPPARLHGDLWSGNLLWTSDRVWLIDPAAYGGHRETDLAMLDLFGAPYLDRIIAAYDEASPLAAGWRERVGLHQLHPLLAHAVMFGAGYGDRAAALARRYA